VRRSLQSGIGVGYGLFFPEGKVFFLRRGKEEGWGVAGKKNIVNFFKPYCESR
jgi:hypothetical protein